ncbi:prolyl-tRNA synthetase [Heterostelium album PN500]|uniref:proline--tRNA ligase n=1 Tax=Heterostelium pallidum (strain ATCC 26659 / Pp 5 / PN500) TaxID=670386 RepID=D3BEV9_HETP5|nr:prolyl-tRNA synthetase [Heterostelium album PN500]EFA80440.1 prolyl-tRNA synthetase [Heterostelium album PN500]|eukprot:XP_020432560.1 prolyl-tRNA synthetase [Heterostelium album PN500]
MNNKSNSNNSSTVLSYFKVKITTKKEIILDSSSSRFTGSQKSEKTSYPVHVDIKSVDFKNSILSGYLTISGLTEKYPVLTTFFEAEIIGDKHSFLTRKWDANETVDMEHWKQFSPAFDPYINKFNKDDFKPDFTNSDYIFMRWKEYFLVPDHHVRSIEGASYEGFYYISYQRSTGTIKGYYYHHLSEWYQSLELKHEKSFRYYSPSTCCRLNYDKTNVHIPSFIISTAPKQTEEQPTSSLKNKMLSLYRSSIRLGNNILRYNNNVRIQQKSVNVVDSTEVVANCAMVSNGSVHVHSTIAQQQQQRSFCSNSNNKFNQNTLNQTIIHQQLQQHQTSYVHRVLRSKLFIPMQRDQPLDKDMLKSQLLMQKTGMIRRASLGMYMTLPLAHRALENLIKIIDQEMSNIGGQKLSMPKLLSKELWEKTGRWESSGDELIKVKDRKGEEYCLAPTHEEIFTSMLANERIATNNLPMKLYQIGDKYRDEIRPRFGLLRGREFLMKDMYSFDKSVADAEETYNLVKTAYHRIFSRLGVNYACVEADSGNIGGSTSHEFQIITDVGEDTIVSCSKCGHSANLEKADAECEPHPEKSPIRASFAMLKNSAGETTIIQLWTSSSDQPNLHSTKSHFSNIVMFEPIDSKQKDALLAKSPNTPIRVFIDQSIQNNSNFEKIYPSMSSSLQSFTVGRFREVKEGDRCVRPECTSDAERGLMKFNRGIEVGHIFRLGTKYSVPLKANIKNSEGVDVPMEMGCYGIGVSRLMAALVEAHKDLDGIVWPIQVAPYKLIILPYATELETENLRKATELYDYLSKEPSLTNQIILEDRLDITFARRIKEATIIGVPYILFVTQSKTRDQDVYELEDRTTGEKSFFNMVELLYFFRFKLS